MCQRKYHILKDLALNVANRMIEERHFSCSLLGAGFGELLFLYLYSSIDNDYETIADALLEEILKHLNSCSIIGTYCNGLSGFAIGISILEKEGFVAGASESLPVIDCHIDKLLVQSIANREIDFLHGFVGYGYYCLERYNSNPQYFGERLLKIISALETMAISIEGKNAIKWQYSGDSSKRYNISISHGMSSIIILLCKCVSTVALSVAEKMRIKALIERSVNYVLMQQVAHDLYGCWFVSTSIDNNVPIYKSRLGWCYGDLGVAIAIYDAAIVLGNDYLKKFALRVLEYSAQDRRGLKDNSVFDMCICHGAAGIAQMFKTMSERANSAVLAEAWHYWDNIVVDNVHATNDRYYYPFFNPLNNAFVTKSGILEGEAGIGLYLLDDTYILPHLLLID